MGRSRVGKITWSCFNYNYNLKFSITITIIQVQVIVIQLQLQKKILKTLQPIQLQTKLRVLLMSTLWICLNCFVFLYQTYQSPIFLYSCSSINLCLTLIFAIHNFACKQLSIVNNCKQSKILG